MLPRRLLLAPVASLLSASPAFADARAARRAADPVLPGGLLLTLPERAENGAQVPIALRAAPPPGLSVRSLHVIATANPAPEILDLEIRDDALFPEIQTRIRLAEEQEIVALALLSDGTAREARARIAEGGCL